MLSWDTPAAGIDLAAHTLDSLTPLAGGAAAAGVRMTSNREDVWSLAQSVHVIRHG
jgi:hypothetical protein